MKVLAVLGEIEDWIAHELSWPVPGHVSSALDLDDAEPAPAEFLFGKREALRLCAAAKGDGRRMFQQEQDVAVKSSVDSPGTQCPL
jgi:hypothetical protein